MNSLNKILSAVLPAAMAFLLMAQTDAYGQPLYLDYKGMAAVVIILWMVFAWNTIKLVLDATGKRIEITEINPNRGPYHDTDLDY